MTDSTIHHRCLWSLPCHVIWINSWAWHMRWNQMPLPALPWRRSPCGTKLYGDTPILAFGDMRRTQHFRSFLVTSPCVYAFLTWCTLQRDGYFDTPGLNSQCTLNDTLKLLADLQVAQLLLKGGERFRFPKQAEAASSCIHFLQTSPWLTGNIGRFLELRPWESLVHVDFRQSSAQACSKAERERNISISTNRQRTLDLRWLAIYDLD